MRYFKLIHGFGPEDSISIDETELEKAFYAHLTGKKALFNEGAIDGARIIAIKPDFHRAMGWNQGYKLGPEDFAELSEKGLDREYKKHLEESKKRVQYLVHTKQINLIGKPFEMPQIENPVGNEVKQLADKMSVGDYRHD